MAVSDIVLLFALTFALYRVGDIWSFQVVLFPLWSKVGRAEFPAYHRSHFHRIFGVIFVPMALSAVSSVLLWLFPPAGAQPWLIYAGLALQAALFVSLAYWIPLQTRIEREGNTAPLMRQLINTHWTRVLNITAFAAVVLALATLRLQVISRS
ncbi:MAG: hypothetical protein JO303_12375 [Caulobacteraceae bacterium]|nr:hypothetical protein [Caulobacteraceae bacterium]